MHVLITGGAGYLGSILAPALLASGHDVTVIDNFTYGQTSLTDVCHLPALHVVRGDARNETLLREHLIGVDVIIPLACLVGALLCEQRPLEARTINLEAVELLLRLREPDQLVIFPTTNSGYGVGTDGVYCTEESPLNPVSLYGQLKVAAERAVLEAGNSITFRLATVFGISPRMRLDLLVNDFTYRALFDRSIVLFEHHFKRNYIHVRDVARAFLFAIDNRDRMRGEPYNVGLSTANLSKLELCEAIQAQTPFEIIRSEIGTDPDQRNYIVSNDKIEALGYTPAHSLDAGIAELIKGFAIIQRNQFSNHI